jgi:hypothetical protein
MHSRRHVDAGTDPRLPGADALAPVIRLRPIRTIVVSPDLAYRERATAVLSGLGRVTFTLASLSEAGEVERLADGRPADVVVLDATDCEAPAQDLNAQLARRAPRTGVVVICHHCTDAARELQALPKWGWTHDLRAAVEDAYREGNPLRPGPLSSLSRRSAWQRMAGPLRRR